MRINLLLFIIFLFFTISVYSEFYDSKRIGCTQLNGAGCVCHSIQADPGVKVWIEGTDTLVTGQPGFYKMFLAGGPAEAGGFNVSGYFGTMGLIDSFSVLDERVPNELTQSFPLPFEYTEDTIYWEFKYTASDFAGIDTLYSIGLSLVYDSIPDFNDKWAYGPKFPITVISEDEPVMTINSDNKKMRYFLDQNYPNPFNPATNINFEIPVNSFVSIIIYDVEGKITEILVDEEMGPGKYNVNFNGSSLSSGIYFCRLKTNNITETKKMLLLK